MVAPNNTICGNVDTLTNTQSMTPLLTNFTEVGDLGELSALSPAPPV